MKWLAETARRLGVLRGALVAVVLGLVALAPFTGGPVELSGLGVLTTLIAPTFYVIVVFVLPLDITMTTVFLKDAEGPERERYRFILRAEVVLLVVLLVSWLPFVLRLLRITG